jgi:hypothetical protein
MDAAKSVLQAHNYGMVNDMAPDLSSPGFPSPSDHLSGHSHPRMGINFINFRTSHAHPRPHAHARRGATFATFRASR